MDKKYEFYYERFFALNRDLFCVMGTDGYFLHVNESWQKILGYTDEEMKSQPFYYFMHPDDIPATVQVASNSAEGTNQLPTFYNRYRAKDGTYHYFDWCGYVEDGLFYGFARDISPMKNKEEELQREKRRMQALLDGQTNYVVRMTAEGKYTYANPQYVKDFGGRYEGDLVGKYFADPVTAAASPVWTTLKRCVAAPGEVLQVELSWENAKGEHVYVLWDFVAIADEQNGLEIQAVGVNISTRKQRETEENNRQQAAIMEMSTPITQLWEGILLLPLVGIMNAQRATTIMGTALKKIADTQARVFILDISGVAVVDTAVANHFIKLSKAMRLMGCVCLMSGISPAVSQTIVELGIQIDEIHTTGTMRDALERALDFTGVVLAAKSKAI